jgi:hypothetical protein
MDDYLSGDKGDKNITKKYVKIKIQKGLLWPVLVVGGVVLAYIAGMQIGKKPRETTYLPQQTSKVNVAQPKQPKFDPVVEAENKKIEEIKEQIETILLKPMYSVVGKEYDIEKLVEKYSEVDILNALRKMTWYYPYDQKIVPFDTLISKKEGTPLERFYSLFSSELDIRFYLWEAAEYIYKTNVFPGDIPRDEYSGYIEYFYNGCHAFDDGNYLIAIDNFNKFIIASYLDGIKNIYGRDDPRRLDRYRTYELHKNAIYSTDNPDEIITIRSAPEANSLQEYLNKLKSEPRIYERERTRAIRRALILSTIYIKNPWIKNDVKSEELSKFFKENVGEEITNEVLNRTYLDKGENIVTVSSLLDELMPDIKFNLYPYNTKFYQLDTTISKLLEIYTNDYLKNNIIVNIPMSPSDVAGIFVYPIIKKFGKEYVNYQKR